MATAANLLERLRTSQLEAIKHAAALIAERVLAGGTIYTFGAGHSYSVALEAYARAGGLRPVRVIGSASLAMLEGAARAARIERLPGYAAAILADYDLRPVDVLLAASNSGVNAAVVETALLARGRGMRIIAITSTTHSRSEAPRHPSGQRLLDLADVVLDNCGVHGDAALALPGVSRRVGPTSTLAGTVLVNALVVQVAANLARCGIDPPVLESGNSTRTAPVEDAGTQTVHGGGPARP